MNTIKLRSIKEIFFQNDPEAYYRWMRSPLALIQLVFGHSRVLFYCLIPFCLFLSLFLKSALIVSLILIAVTGLCYFWAKELASNLQVNLGKIPSGLSEGDSCEINVTVTNSSSFLASGMSLSLSYFACKTPELRYPILAPIESHKVRHFIFKVENNVGMGRFKVGPISIFVRDFLGLFEFEAQFPLQKEIEIFPRLESVLDVPTQGSFQSDVHGSLELRTRGLSVNLSGVRPYVFGDSIRHIAWRSSARLGTLIVKEFEKIVNTDATLILNLNPNIHLGAGAVSTWESAKDISLSLVSQFISQGHSIQFGSNDFFVEKGFGQDQFALIARSLVKYDIFERAAIQKNDTTYTPDPLGKWLSSIPDGSTVVYVMPLNYNDLSYSLANLAKLTELKNEVILILVNPTSFMAAFREINPQLSFPRGRTNLEKLLSQIKALGIRVYSVDIGQPLRSGFKEMKILGETHAAP